MIADNTPIIVGSAQLVDRQASVERHIQPLDMLLNTATDAAADAGLKAAALSTLDTVALVGVSGWHPQNPPGLVAEKLAATGAKNLYTTGDGGQMGVQLLNAMADKIIAGESEFTLVAGCNNLRVLFAAIAKKQQLDWQRGGTGEPQWVGGNAPGNNALEKQYGLSDPADIYPLFENALRAKLGLNLEQHRQRMGDLFAPFTEVAANNPHAWFPTARSSEELTTVSPNNRMIAWPYPKYLNAILATEQAASVLMMSAGRARKMGIPEQHWVYWRGGAHSQEQAYWTSERPDFASCPSMQDTTLSSLHNSGYGLNNIDHFDFYSCFPVAVQMACQMTGLAIDDPRGFTVTGGLPYAGGPASAYTLHSLATMATKLRGSTAESGLVTGNGWYLTKHAAAVLSSEPPSQPVKPSGLMAVLPSADLVTTPREVNEQATGGATVEAYTVKYGRDGAAHTGIVLGTTDSGDRFLANTPTDIDFLENFVAVERIGCAGQLSQQQGQSLFIPA